MSRRRLKTFAKVIAGQSPSSDDVQPLENGTPFIQGNAEFGRLYPTPIWESFRAQKRSQKGDILVSVRAPIGAVNIATGSIGLGRGVAAVRAIDPSAQGWLYWALIASRGELQGKGTGSTFAAITADDLKALELTIPTQPSIIAEYLDHETSEIDTLVTELYSAQDLARERHSAALERLMVTDGPVPSELRRHNPHRKSGTSVNGAPWPADPGEPGVLKTGAASQRAYRPHENKAVIDPVEQARLSTPVEADRVLVNRANTPSNVGAAAYIEHGNDNLFLSDKLWSIDFQGVNEYFAFAMQTCLYQDQASQRAVGASLSMQNLPYDEFLSIRLPVPSVERQRSICATLREEQRSINASVSDLDRAITLAKERRAALITAAVTGQIDVTAKRRPAAEQLEDDIKELS